jgi:Zn ribbon nucleic-acid-binding protein
MTSFREGGRPGCPACKTVEVNEMWRDLKLVATMHASDLFPSSATWAGRAIEIRECPLCGRSVARATPAARVAALKA